MNNCIIKYTQKDLEEAVEEKVFHIAKHMIRHGIDKWTILSCTEISEEKLSKIIKDNDEYLDEYYVWVRDALKKFGAKNADTLIKEFKLKEKLKDCPLIAYHDDPKSLAEDILRHEN